MQSGQKQVVVGKGEKEGERRKEKRKREKEEKKKKRKKKKERNKGWEMQQIKKKEEKKKEKRKEKKKEKKRKNHGGVSSDSVYLSPVTSPGTCPSSWSSGGVACFADFQVLALGGAALSSAWCRAQWGLFNL